MLVTGDKLNIFLLTGIPNINIFFIKKMNNVVVKSNKYDIQQRKKIDITQTNLLKTNPIDFHL